MGIEPTDEGFADLSLTTWVPRQTEQYIQVSSVSAFLQIPPRIKAFELARCGAKTRDAEKRASSLDSQKLTTRLTWIGREIPLCGCCLMGCAVPQSRT